MDVYYLHAKPRFIFFFKTLADPDQPAPYLIRTQTVFISACKYMEFNNWLKFGRNIVYMYMIIQTQLCPKKCITHLCEHKPQPQYMVMAETSNFGIFRGRKCPGQNVLGWNVRGQNVLYSWGQLAGKTMTILPPQSVIILHCHVCLGLSNPYFSSALWR